MLALDIDDTIIYSFIPVSDEYNISFFELFDYIKKHLMRNGFTHDVAYKMANKFFSMYDFATGFVEQERGDVRGTLGVIEDIKKLGIKVICVTARPDTYGSKIYTDQCFRQFNIPIPVQDIVFCGDFIDKGTALLQFFRHNNFSSKIVFLVDDREDVLCDARRGLEVFQYTGYSSFQFIPVLYAPKQVSTDDEIIKNVLKNKFGLDIDIDYSILLEQCY
jgi:hypothetical protein